jgi:hypothetical protein
MVRTRRSPSLWLTMWTDLPRPSRDRVTPPLYWTGMAVIAVALLCALVVPPVSSASVPGRAPAPVATPVPTTCPGQADEAPATLTGSWAAAPQDSLACDEDDLDDDDDDASTSLTPAIEAGLPGLPPPAVRRAEGVTNPVPRPARFLVRPQLLIRH